jgi:DNA-binding CsgD family transcriptional regulator
MIRSDQAEHLLDLAQRLLDARKLNRTQFTVFRMGLQGHSQKTIAAFFGCSQQLISFIWRSAKQIVQAAAEVQREGEARIVHDIEKSYDMVLIVPDTTVQGWIDAEREELQDVLLLLNAEADKYRQDMRNKRREKRRNEREAEKKLLES